MVVVLLGYWPSEALATNPAPSVFTVDNTAKYSDGHYSWTLFITGDDNTLRNVDHVEYTLHPSFPTPVQTVRVRGGKCAFALSSTSWGEFKIGVKVFFKDGTSMALKYWLNLLDNRNATGCDEKNRTSLPSPRRVTK